MQFHSFGVLFLFPFKLSSQPLTMSEDFNKKRPSTRYRFRAMMNISIGILYLILGIAVATMRKFGSMQLSSAWTIGACAILIVYGGFRIWRGVQDLKLTEEDEA
jgi:hypothetical protein